MAEKQDLEMELHDSRQSFEELKIKSDELELEKISFSQKQGTTERDLEKSGFQSTLDQLGLKYELIFH